MTAAFIVHLNISDLSATSLAELAGDIEDDLLKAGHDVDSVAPYAHPTIGPVPIGGVAGVPQVAAPVQPPPPPVLF